MKRSHSSFTSFWRLGFALAGSLLTLCVAPAAETPPTTGIGLPVLGKVHPRAALEIPASRWWSIGGEVMDRDFTIYDHFKKYIGPLGAKSIRLQAGWAKCEKQPGVYSWQWLDAIV